MTHVEVRQEENRRSTLLAAAAWAVDVSLFDVCLSSGLDLSVAQMVSFAATVAVIYFRKRDPHLLTSRINSGRSIGCLGSSVWLDCWSCFSVAAFCLSW